MLKKLLNSYIAERRAERKAELQRNLIRREAKIGGTIFGPVAPGVRRDFFCLDSHTWIWYEQWQENGQQRARTIRYSVRPDGILKTQDGTSYLAVTPKEAYKLYQAARAYQQKIRQQLYSFVT